MKDDIAQAIQERKKLKITCLYQDGVPAELKVMPLVLGKDFFGYNFLFGKIDEFFHNFYKFRLDQIKKVELINEEFILPKEAVYVHAFGEDWEVVDKEFRESRTFCREPDGEYLNPPNEL